MLHIFSVLVTAADLPIVLQRLPSVQLVLQSASQLKYVLGLRGPVGGSATDLKQIIRQGMNEKHGFSVSDLVLGLLLTPSLGRYVTLLLPYCKLVKYQPSVDYMYMCMCIVYKIACLVVEYFPRLL